MLDIIIKNSRIVNEDRSVYADIAIKDGKIAAIGKAEYFEEAEKVIDGRGKLAVPGLIDSHVHVNMTMGEFSTTDTMENATVAAAYGGTTSVVMFAIPVEDERPLTAMEKTRELAKGHCAVNYSFHAAITRVNEQSFQDIEDMLSGGIPSVKMFSIYKSTVMLPSIGIHRTLDKIKKYNGIALIHAESAPYIDALIEEKISRGETLPVDHMKSRPPISEAMEVANLIPLVEYTGAPTLFVHMTTSMVRDSIAHAKKKGIPVYTELCPHYLTLTDEVYERENGQDFVCSPPMRTSNNVAQMWDMLRDGLGDIISSDHSAYTKEQKLIYRNFFPKMPNGLPGIETRGPVMFSAGVAGGKITENQFVRNCSSNTARLMGMYPEKGRIAPGADADIVLIDPKEKYVMKSEDLHMMTDYTPFEGMEMTGRFTDVIVGGRMVIENNRYTGAVTGKEIKRHSPELY